jgi:hypothetical protein
VLYLNNNQHGMRNIKFANDKQAKEIDLYENIRTKLQKTKAAIWYDKTCKQLQLSPNCIHIQVSGSSRQSYNTLKTATQFHIKHTVKYLYVKKYKCNEQLYEIRPQRATIPNKHVCTIVTIATITLPYNILTTYINFYLIFT